MLTELSAKFAEVLMKQIYCNYKKLYRTEQYHDSAQSSSALISIQNYVKISLRINDNQTMKEMVQKLFSLRN